MVSWALQKADLEDRNPEAQSRKAKTALIQRRSG
jgi:hypothetical protein